MIEFMSAYFDYRCSTIRKVDPDVAQPERLTSEDYAFF